MASRRIDGKKSTDKPKATVEEELPKEEGESVPSNKFANDGSFLEIFKQMQKVRSEEGLNSGSESQKLVAPKLVAETATSSGGPERSVKQQSVKRRKVLKTGIIKRERKDEDDDNGPTDSWTKYMTEVKKYKEMHGDDSDKNRPLVK